MKMGDYKAIYEDWKNRVEKNPSELTLAGLEDSIIGWKNSYESMDRSLANYSHNYSAFERVDFRKHIRQRRALVQELSLLLDEYEKRLLSIDEKIELWISKNIPNSPNKDEYLKAFKVICEQPKPKECGNPFLLDKIHEEFEPTISDQMLRKRFTVFKNTFPF